MAKLGDKFDEGVKRHQEEKERNAKKADDQTEKSIREKLEKSNLNESQYKFCLSTSRNIRLLAPAGSGKTLSLLWRCRVINERKKQSRSKFLVVTFTRVARDELRQRLTLDKNFADIRESVRITTLNEWGYQYLRKNEGSLKVISSDYDRFEIMDHDFRPIFKSSTKKIAGFYKETTKKRGRYVDMMKIFDTMKNCGFCHDTNKNELHSNFEKQRKWLEENGLERYFTEEITKKLIQLKILDETDTSINGFRPFLKVWQETCYRLWENGKITLDDQKYRSLIEFRKRYATNPSSLPVPSRYQHVLVDEFQDISPLDMFFVKTLSGIYGSSLTIVGDDDQAIFEWRGSTPNFILYPENYFDGEFETHILEVNYRSPQNVVDISQKLIKHNKKRVDKKVESSVKENADVKVKKFPTHNECVDYILKFAREANETSKPRQLGIIGRKKGQLIPMQIALISKEIPFFARQDLNVAFSKAFQDLKEILEIVSTPHLGTPTNVANSFLKLMNYVNLYPIPKKIRNKIFYHLSNRDVSNIESCLESIQLFDDFSNTEKDTFRSAISEILPNDRGVSEVMQSIEENLKGLQKHYPKSEDDIFYKDPPFPYLAEYASRYEKNFPGFIKHLGKSIEEMLKKEKESSKSSSRGH